MAGGHVAELAAMELAHRLVKPLENPDAPFGNSGANDAAIRSKAFPSNKAARFQAVEDAGDVGIARDHTVANLPAGAPLRFRAAEDAHDVVLGRGQVAGLEELLNAAEREIGGPLQSNKKPALESKRGTGFAEAIHRRDYSRYNDYCQGAGGPALRVSARGGVGPR